MREKQNLRIQHISKNQARWDARLSEDANLIRFRRKLDVNWIMGHMSYYMADRALYFYFVKNDIQQLRQNCYTAALLRLNGTIQKKAPSSEPYSITTPPLLCALLSDSHDITNKYSEIKTPISEYKNSRPLASDLEIAMIQSAMRNLNDELLEYINIARYHRSKIEKGRYKSNFFIIRGLPTEDFFEALLLRDKERLQTLVQKHYTNNAKDAIFEDLLSVDGCIRTKLCWRRGIEIRPISPLIPLDLMPVEPLEHYRYEYDFLEPGWTPPRQGWLGDFERFIKRKLATLHR